MWKADCGLEGFEIPNPQSEIRNHKDAFAPDA
jgi:hypothetical protein